MIQKVYVKGKTGSDIHDFKLNTSILIYLINATYHWNTISSLSITILQCLYKLLLTDQALFIQEREVNFQYDVKFLEMRKFTH